MIVNDAIARRKRLPKWAQEELESLERRLAERTRERDRLRERTPPSPIQVNPSGLDGVPDFYLDEKDRVRFALPGTKDWRDYIEVRLERGQLVLHGGGSLVVRPHVTNLVYVGLDAD